MEINRKTDPLGTDFTLARGIPKPWRKYFFLGAGIGMGVFWGYKLYTKTAKVDDRLDLNSKAQIAIRDDLFSQLFTIKMAIEDMPTKDDYRLLKRGIDEDLTRIRKTVDELASDAMDRDEAITKALESIELNTKKKR